MADRAKVAAEGSAGNETQRLDKWLWFVRVVKTRTQAAGLVTEGLVRVNRVKVDKPSHTVRPGDVVTVGLRNRVRVLEVLAGGSRRGSPTEAALLCKDISPPVERPAEREASLGGDREPGSGRPTKKDRRQTDRLRWSDDGGY